MLGLMNLGRRDDAVLAVILRKISAKHGHCRVDTIHAPHFEVN